MAAGAAVARPAAAGVATARPAGAGVATAGAATARAAAAGAAAAGPAVLGKRRVRAEMRSAAIKGQRQGRCRQRQRKCRAEQACRSLVSYIDRHFRLLQACGRSSTSRNEPAMRLPPHWRKRPQTIARATRTKVRCRADIRLPGAATYAVFPAPKPFARGDKDEDVHVDQERSCSLSRGHDAL